MVKWKLRGKNKIGEMSLLSELATVNKKPNQSREIQSPYKGTMASG